MRSVNKVIIIGNLTRDPEMRQTPNGQSVTTFGLATNREWTTKEGDRKGSAEFHECVAWARLAEICAEYLKKGNLIYVEGYIKTRSWDSPEGTKKFKTEIVVQDMIMLEKKQQEEGAEATISDTPKEEESAEKSKAEEAKEEEPAEEPKAEEAKEEEPAEEPKAEEAAEEKPAEEPKTEEATEEPPSEENPIDKDLGL